LANWLQLIADAKLKSVDLSGMQLNGANFAGTVFLERICPMPTCPPSNVGAGLMGSTHRGERFVDADDDPMRCRWACVSDGL